MPIQLPYPYTPGLPGSGLGDPEEYADSIQANLDALAIATGQVTQYAPWIVVGATGAPAFKNSWANSGVFTGNPARFYKDAMGIVRVEGTVASGTSGLAMFTLPAGYRPAQSDVRFAVNANDAFGSVYVASNGDVALNAGSTTGVHLDAVQFRADQ